MLNALLWMAKVDVPREGVKDTITADDLRQNLDPKRRRGSSQVLRRSRRAAMFARAHSSSASVRACSISVGSSLNTV